MNKKSKIWSHSLSKPGGAKVIVFLLVIQSMARIMMVN